MGSKLISYDTFLLNKTSGQKKQFFYVKDIKYAWKSYTLLPKRNKKV